MLLYFTLVVQLFGITINRQLPTYGSNDMPEHLILLLTDSSVLWLFELMLTSHTESSGCFTAPNPGGLNSKLLI